MMYSQKLVASIKVNNKILREKFKNNESTVFIPFGSEYSILLKNLSGQNAVVDIELDGRKVSKNGLYIRQGQTCEVERFVESLKEGRRFKFIEKTEEISNYRGDKIDDGIIRITWQYEKIKPVYVYNPISIHHLGCRCEICRPNWWYSPLHPYYGYNSNTSVTVNNIGSSISGTASNAASTDTLLKNCSGEANYHCSNTASDLGITVEGSKSNQQFTTAYASELEENIHSMVICLKGFKNKEYIHKPITVKTKKKCSSCGRKWKGNVEFCPNCGTALID